MKIYVSGEDHLTFVFEADMSLQANLRAIRIGQALTARQVDGLVECYPTNTSLMVRFDTDLHQPGDVVAIVQNAVQAIDRLEAPALRSRVIGIPTWFDDPVTRACQEQFASFRRDPNIDDLTYCARVNGLSGKEEMIDRFAGAPWIVSASGFYPGCFEGFQLVDPSRQLTTPKYVSPRLHTPERTVGQAGCFAGIYPYASAGGYQMLGRAAGPIYQPDGNLADFSEGPALLKAGDIIVFQPIDEQTFTALEGEVERGTFRYRISQVEFSLDDIETDPAGVSLRIRKSVDN
ncbi:carboxyltransferase domain-containing protein [Nocardia sp. NPDC047038]|uniref:5-oxoprolinase subunit B family protein n=1 Tax=Nocardia sp. NPDC047038 TaxID=3154338 RepID=UPI00340E2082